MLKLKSAPTTGLRFRASMALITSNSSGRLVAGNVGTHALVSSGPSIPTRGLHRAANNTAKSPLTGLRFRCPMALIASSSIGRLVAGNVGTHACFLQALPCGRRQLSTRSPKIAEDHIVGGRTNEAAMREFIKDKVDAARGFLAADSSDKITLNNKYTHQLSFTLVGVMLAVVSVVLLTAYRIGSSLETKIANLNAKMESKVDSLSDKMTSMRMSLAVLVSMMTSASPHKSQALNSLHMAIQNRVTDCIASAPVVVFMKGTQKKPMCIYGQKIKKVLDLHHVPFKDFDVLEDEELRQGIKDFSDWPTFPQVYVNGKFVGGSDIVVQMHKDGEIAKFFDEEGIPSRFSGKFEPPNGVGGEDGAGAAGGEQPNKK